MLIFTVLCLPQNIICSFQKRPQGLHHTQMVYSTLYPDGIQYSAIFKAFKNAKMEDNLFFILDNMSETGKVKFRVQFSPWQV